MLSRAGRVQALHAHARSIWTARTLISSSPASLLSALERDQSESQSNAGERSVTLYAISKNLPSDTLSSARSQIFQKNNSLGVLSEVLPTGLVAHLAPNQAPSGRNMTGPFSIALATYTPRDENHKIVPFKSTVQGRPNIALGREIKQDTGSNGPRASEDRAFEEFLRTGKMAFGAGPKDQDPTDLPELHGVSRKDVKQLTFFTADRNAPFLHSLQKYAGHAQTLGLMASSTPFQSETHAPYTLFYREETLGAGAVGVALVDTSGLPSDIQGNVEYSGLQAVDVPTEVTKSQGNIVIELDGKNAARLMLEKIRTLPSAPTTINPKEKEFYAAVYDRKPTGHLNTNDALSVTRIMSGDPSRGAISIETAEDIEKGYWITILHRPEPASYATFDNTLAQFNFVSVDPSDASASSSSAKASALPDQGDVAVVPGFVAASENGIVVGRQDREPYVTDIDHVVGRTVEERVKERL